MGGYRARTYRLTFGEDHELHGLEAVVTAPSLQDYMQILRNSADDSVSGEEAIRFEQNTFAECLLEWNLEAADRSLLPATPAGVALAPTPEVRGLIRAWFRETTSVPGPLEQRSAGGATSGVLSLPMEPPSESQAS